MSNVWILGAGFSKGAGGPLTSELFDVRMGNRIRAEFDTVLRLECIEDVASKYARADGYGERQLTKDMPWSSPEEFLALVERAAATPEDSSLRRFLNPFLQSADLTNLPSLIRRYFAMACTAFIPENRAALKDVEHWRPYFTWAKRLRADDTVISYNYDELVETVCLNRINCLTPDFLSGGDTVPSLLKMHGSVGWHKTSGGKIVTPGGRALLAQGHEPLLGIPGPSKGGVASRDNPFCEMAADAIRHASTINIVGYRFAETDDDAKALILGAVSENKVEPLTVRIVLGLQGREDAERVAALFMWALRSRGARRLDHIKNADDPSLRDKRIPMIDVVPMYAQDFIALAKPEEPTHSI